MYNISFIKGSRWPHHPSFKYQIGHKSIVRHNWETMVNFELRLPRVKQELLTFPKHLIPHGF